MVFLKIVLLLFIRLLVFPKCSQDLPSFYFYITGLLSISNGCNWLSWILCLTRHTFAFVWKIIWFSLCWLPAWWDLAYCFSHRELTCINVGNIYLNSSSFYLRIVLSIFFRPCKDIAGGIDCYWINFCGIATFIFGIQCLFVFAENAILSETWLILPVWYASLNDLAMHV